jgi:hypothetical protein
MEYWIEAKRDGKWARIPFTQEKKQWCEGYIACLSDHYPSNPARLVDENGKVWIEFKGNCKPHTN